MAIGLVLVALAAGAPAVGAETELERARAELDRIADEIRAEQAILDRLSNQVAAAAERVNRAEVRLEETRAMLEETRRLIDQARARHEALGDRLDARARDLFMQGPAASVAFVLGASSMADLSDRLEFGSAMVQADADLSTAVQNLQNELEADEAEQQRLEDREAETLGELQAELSELDEAFRQQEDAYAAIEAERRRAEDLVADLRREWQQELATSIPAATTGGGTSSTGPGAFQVCPVALPHALTDSFGAPRYGGGYHLHAGVDIMAPSGTSIYATFAGTAVDSSNGLGGIAVRVIGSSGWTYNAHLSSIGQLGSVQAGDVIGYVGATGDTSTPHNHFEWHPNALPSDWPASAYGYSVIGDAVNPYPMLVAAC